MVTKTRSTPAPASKKAPAAAPSPAAAARKSAKATKAAKAPPAAKAAKGSTATKTAVPPAAPAGMQGLAASLLNGPLRQSAQQIWLAGMGALKQAQAEGSKVFEGLVKEGVDLQQRQQGAAQRQVDELAGQVGAMAERATVKAAQGWDKLEALFEQRTAKAVKNLGLPGVAEWQALLDRVAALEAEVAALKGARPAAAPARPRRTQG